MKAPFAYYGGKAGLAPLIVSMLPPHRVYVEPFFGSGAVLFTKRPSVHEIVNDLDHNVVTFFRMLREQPDQLEMACRLTPYARAEYAASELDDLAEVLLATPAAVVLSGYPSPLYERLYADWWRVDVPVRVHASNAVTSERGERTEVLWSNRPLDEGRLSFAAVPNEALA